MTMTIAITYKGELIVAGERTRPPWEFWTVVKPAPEFNTERVARRLKEIYEEDRVGWAYIAGAFHFPPKFDVKEDYALAEGD